MLLMFGAAATERSLADAHDAVWLGDGDKKAVGGGCAVGKGGQLTLVVLEGWAGQWDRKGTCWAMGREGN